MDVSKKGESAMPAQSGLKAPGELSGLVGNRPVLDNRWGSKLANSKQSNAQQGKGKK